ncbi:MAG: DUF3127 domain-containing protein [Bacteroidales bacterium]|jgi:hypothetical protein|nr:DUF3127 domain-containing protein [Bacteroidales bacterium]
MEIIGKFIKKLPETTGESQKGQWIRGGFVIETEEQFPKQVAFSLWGEDKVAQIRNMRTGTTIKVYFSPESREFNERWYTDLRCFRIDAFTNVQSSNGYSSYPSQNMQPSEGGSAPQVHNEPQTNQDYGSFNNMEPQEDDDLPF